MARYFDVHPENPQPRALDQVARILQDSGVIAYATDSGFALGALGMALMPDFPATDMINAVAIGIVSGLAATGADQAAKQLTKTE